MVVPVRVGSGEWVDPSTFTPRAPSNSGVVPPRPPDPYVYDVLMVASWDPLKRHEVLLEALADLRARGRALKVGLVGVPSRWKLADVQALVDRHGLRDQITFHERIPHAEVHSLPGTHCLPLEFPDRIMDMLRDLYARASWAESLAEARIVASHRVDLATLRAHSLAVKLRNGVARLLSPYL